MQAVPRNRYFFQIYLIAGRFVSALANDVWLVGWLVGNRGKNKTPGAEVKTAQTAVIYTKKQNTGLFLNLKTV